MDATEQRSATADPVVRLEFDLEWPPNLVAASLVTEPEPLLIDAATPADHGERSMAEELASAGYALGDLAGVVVTHPHSDHVGAVPELREAGVDVYAPEPAIDQLQRDADDLRAGVREVGRSVGLDAERIEREAERAVDSLTRNRTLLDPDHTRGFAFGEEFSVAGLSLEPLHTPGHQVHHASLATTVDGERAMFSGDALIEPFRAAALNVGIDYGAYDAIDAFYTAMDRFAGRDVDRVYPGHGPVFTDYEDAIESTRAALDGLVADTREAVAAAAPATPVAVAEDRVGEVEHLAHLLDTIGALGTLDRRGDVEYGTEEGVRNYEPA